MNSARSDFTILILTVPLLTGVVVSSVTGFYTYDFYALESLNWQIQSSGQDMIDLFVVAPVLAISAFMAYRGSKRALLIWAGANLYLIYTFLIFCFAVHFNSLFLLYCMNLGLAFYSILYFILRMVELHAWKSSPGKVLRKITSIFFLLISILFMGLWLSDIFSWMKELPVPKTLQEIGLLTNPVHVLDISVFLPGIFVIGILLWRSNPAGTMLAPVVLTFFVLMDITIAALNYMMQDIVPDAQNAITWVMMILAFISGILLFFLIRAFSDSGDNRYAAQI